MCIHTLFLSFLKLFPPGPFMGSRIRHPASQDVVDELGGLRQEREEAARREQKEVNSHLWLLVGGGFKYFVPPQFGEDSHCD